MWRSKPALVPLAIFPACKTVSVPFRAVLSGPECELALLATPPRIDHNTTRRKTRRLTGSAGKCGMEGSTVNFSEDGGGRGRDAAGGKDVASCARFGQEDYERPDGGVFQAVQRQYASCATAGDGSQVGDAFTRSVDVCGTPDGAEPQPVLSEALRDPHWGEEGLLMNRGPPGNDWATFSPVDSSSRYHTTDASNWVQTIAESSEEEPTITSDTPGWQAFSLGGDVATTTTTSASWSETSASVGDSNAPATAGRKQSGNCGAGERDQTEPCATVYSRSCVTVFRECFTSAEGASNGRRGEEREGRPRPVTAECVGDWRCMEDNRCVQLYYKCGYC